MMTKKKSSLENRKNNNALLPPLDRAPGAGLSSPAAANHRAAPFGGAGEEEEEVDVVAAAAAAAAGGDRRNDSGQRGEEEEEGDDDDDDDDDNDDDEEEGGGEDAAAAGQSFPAARIGLTRNALASLSPSASPLGVDSGNTATGPLQLKIKREFFDFNSEEEALHLPYGGVINVMMFADERYRAEIQESVTKIQAALRGAMTRKKIQRQIDEKKNDIRERIADEKLAMRLKSKAGEGGGDSSVYDPP